jgi:hypothetical protein
MQGEYRQGSFVIPTVDGNYVVPPAQTIETFWAYKRTSDGTPIEDRSDMMLVYREVDPATWESVGGGAREMTPEIWAMALSTSDHPHFI